MTATEAGHLVAKAKVLLVLLLHLLQQLLLQLLLRLWAIVTWP
jgi:hypothetical protein